MINDDDDEDDDNDDDDDVIPHICHFFSTGTIFGYIFLHIIARKSQKTIMRQNSENRQKKQILQQNSVKCNKIP